MTQGKRKHIPKIRGCYECSQRRIHCDRGLPSCGKCIAKGIQCSGLGTRYRFHEIKDSKVLRAGRHNSSQEQPSTALMELNTQRNSADDVHPTPVSFLDSCETWKQYLFCYFASKIACKMDYIDDQYNGWHHIVLPVAYYDELVREAVMSAAAFHFSANVKKQVFNPHAIYSKTIHLLRQRQDLGAYEATKKQTILLALLVLIATVMVAGSSDFPTIFKLLESALEAGGGEEALMQGELGMFVIRQIRKYRGYAAPFLSQTEGFARLSLTALSGLDAVNGWDCFKLYYGIYPNMARTMALVYELDKLSCDIYVARVSAGPNGPALTELVKRWRTTMEQLPVDSPIEHSIVFSSFLAASESVLPEDQEFFTNTLLRHHRRNGFENIIVALEQLRSIWSERTKRDWPEKIPAMQVLVV